MVIKTCSIQSQPTIMVNVCSLSKTMDLNFHWENFVLIKKKINLEIAFDRQNTGEGKCIIFTTDNLLSMKDKWMKINE